MNDKTICFLLNSNLHQYPQLLNDYYSQFKLELDKVRGAADIELVLVLLLLVAGADKVSVNHHTSARASADTSERTGNAKESSAERDSIPKALISTSSMYQKRNRTTFNQYQLNVLEEAFRQNSYPCPSLREALALKTNLDPSRIQVWFQNRRAKHKKQVNQAMRCFTGNSNNAIGSSNNNNGNSNQQHHGILGIPTVANHNVELSGLSEPCTSALQHHHHHQQMALDLHLNSTANLHLDNDHIMIVQQQNGIDLESHGRQHGQQLYSNDNQNDNGNNSGDNQLLSGADLDSLQLQNEDSEHYPGCSNGNNSSSNSNNFYSQHLFNNCNITAVTVCQQPNQLQQQLAEQGQLQLAEHGLANMNQQVIHQQQQQHHHSHHQLDHQSPTTSSSCSSLSSFTSAISHHQEHKQQQHNQSLNSNNNEQSHNSSSSTNQQHIQHQQTLMIHQQQQRHPSLFAICSQPDEFCQRLNNQLSIAAAAAVAGNSMVTLTASSTPTPTLASTPSPNLNGSLQQFAALPQIKAEQNLQQQYQQRQQHDRQEYCNYYKQIGSLRSTVEYLH